MLFMAACLACTAQESTPQPRPGDSEAVERVIMSRRSIRKYTPQKIGRETLQEILRCGINAPNGQNRQAYEIRVIDDAALLTEISDAARARGIGSCCMAFPVSLMKGSDACQPMIKKMGLSEGYDLIYCITMGYPDETPQAKPRKEEKIVFVE